MVAAAINLLFGILAVAVGREIALGPKAALANNVFYPLEPSQILRMVIRKIKRLSLPSLEIEAIVHVWPIQVMRPNVLGIFKAYQ